MQLTIAPGITTGVTIPYSVTTPDGMYGESSGNNCPACNNAAAAIPPARCVFPVNAFT